MDTETMFSIFRPLGAVNSLAKAQKMELNITVRISLLEYQELWKRIQQLICDKGYPPPGQVIAKELKCEPTTAWRIVKSLG